MSMRFAVCCLALATALSGCYSPDNDPTNASTLSSKSGGRGLFGPGANDLGSGSGKQAQTGDAIGVNSFLWRAALDTLSFIPLASADPFGGVIITDWYSPPETPDERFKVNVFILDRKLTADGIRAAVFRQKRDRDGKWNDSTVSSSTQTDLENSILTRARQLRVSTVQN